MHFSSNGWAPSKVFEAKLEKFQLPKMEQSISSKEIGKMKTIQEAQQKAREKEYISKMSISLCAYRTAIKRILSEQQPVFMNRSDLQSKNCTNIQGVLERIAKFGNYSKPYLELLITDGEDSCGKVVSIPDPGKHVVLVIVLLPLKNESNAQSGFQQRKDALQAIAPWATIISPSEISNNLLTILTRSKTQPEQLVSYNHSQLNH
jgi:hypothetical protein